MSAENWSGSLRDQGSDAVLRHPDGSIDIGAYAVIAHRERAAAIASSMLSAAGFIHEARAAITRAILPDKGGKACVDSQRGFKPTSLVAGKCNRSY